MKPDKYMMKSAGILKKTFRFAALSAVFFACMFTFMPAAFGVTPPNNPEPSGDVLLYHAVSAISGTSYAFYKISDLPYTIQKGDVLEFDVTIWKYSAEPKGSIDIQFTDKTTLADSGANDQFGLPVGGDTSLNIATGKWMHRAVALDNFAGKTAAEWNICEKGGRMGDYFVAFDNIVVTNNEKIQAEIYRNSAPQSAAPGARVAYTVSRLQTVKFTDLDAELAKNLTADMLLGVETIEQWIAGRPGEADLRELIKSARKTVDMESCRAARRDACDASVKKALAVLGPVSKLIKSYELDYVGHGHIDMNWLWLWPETQQVIHDTFSSVLKLMDEFPDFKYSQSQASTYVVAEEKYPDIFKQIQKRVAEGRWELTGGTWVEGDLNMASGESIVRSIMYSKRYFKDKFGKEVEVLWEPDTFGHAWTIPQIMRKSGLKYYFFTRCGKDKPLFWWEGPDGSRVLALNGRSYGESIQGSNDGYLEAFEKKAGLKTGAIVYGVGDHGGGPTRADIEKGEELRKSPLYPVMRFSFFKDFMDSILPHSDKLPVIRDELNFTFRGCYTTHADVKKANRKSESIMNLSETASVLAADHGRTYNTKGYVAAWRNIAFNQFHDIFDGSAIHGSYEYSHELYDTAFKIAGDETDGALAYLAERVHADKNEGIPILVFNSLGWKRSDPVEATAVFPSNPAAVTVSDGIAETGAQIIDTKDTGNGVSVRVLFIANGVPPAGYKTFYLKSAEKSTAFGVIVSKDFIENKYFRVEIDHAKGDVSRIYDKVNNREVLPEGAGANLLQMLLEAPNGMAAWDIGAIQSTTDLDSSADITVAEQGPVRASISIRRSFSKSQFTQNVTLYDSLPRIDFPCKVAWREVGNTKTGMYMLKVKFPVAVTDGKAAFEIPFGSIERPANGEEVPAQKWIDLSDGGYGVSLLNDSKYGHDVKDNVMRLTLLRSSYSPDPLPDFGNHDILYSLYPHKGDWKAAGTVRQGYDLNHPLAAFAITNTLPNASLPVEYSFLRIEPSSLVITAMKISEDDKNRLIVRFYDSEGAGGRGAITFNAIVGDMKETDLLEREIKSDRFKKNGSHYDFGFGKSEIITLSVKLGGDK